MDGPMVNNLAYKGTFAFIQVPASRPPGTPPVPARKAGRRFRLNPLPTCKSHCENSSSNEE